MILGFLFLLAFIIVMILAIMAGLDWVWIVVIGLAFLIVWYFAQNVRSKKEHTKLGIKA